MQEACWDRFRRQAAGELPAGAALARRVPAGLTPGELGAPDEAALWDLHAAAQARLRAGPPDESPLPPGQASLLDLKVELARRLLAPCRLCWLRCPVDRLAGERGRCGLGAGLPVYRDFVHLGEELELIPTHAVYLGGCNYRCAYCSEWSHVVRPVQDGEVDPAALARSIDARRREGAQSVSFVGGLPDVNLPGILRALQALTESVPVVWNSNLSATPEAQDLLEGVVDAYVADLKYGNPACARAGSQVEGSLPVVQRNLERVAGEAYLIVRHLVLPGHLDCCALPVLRWIAARLPGVRVNLMPHYQPTPQVAGSAWDRRPAAADLARAREEALRLGLDLEGPGQLPARAPRGGDAAPAVAGFESRIRLGPDGEVVIEDLDPQLAELARELGLGDALGERGQAAAPWLEPEA